MLKRFLSMAVLFIFFVSSVVGPNCAYAQGVFLPEPGTMVGTSAAYVPVILKGLTVRADNPLLFDLIVDTGNSGLQLGTADDAAIKEESQKLAKYFLASLTLPEKEQWVNLSPYEGNRMLPEELGKTELGRDMLAQDYLLKQVTASLIYPEKELGATFWKRVYERAAVELGTTDIPVDTFNKVWIVADKADVYVSQSAASGQRTADKGEMSAFVVDSHLKVMLEADYLAMQKSADNGQQPAEDVESSGSQELAKQVIRDIVLPELEKEINTGKNFAQLRQIFHSMILATWYKKNLKEALLTQVYADQNKTGGVEGAWVAEKGADVNPEEIWNQYVEAYKKGVFNYIKEDVDQTTGETVPHKYFSGGVAPNLSIDQAMRVATRPGVLASGRITGEALRVAVAANLNANAAQEVVARRLPVPAGLMWQNPQTWSTAKALADQMANGQSDLEGLRKNFGQEVGLAFGHNAINMDWTFAIMMAMFESFQKPEIADSGEIFTARVAEIYLAIKDPLVRKALIDVAPQIALTQIPGILKGLADGAYGQGAASVLSKEDQGQFGRLLAKFDRAMLTEGNEAPKLANTELPGIVSGIKPEGREAAVKRIVESLGKKAVEFKLAAPNDTDRQKLIAGFILHGADLADMLQVIRNPFPDKPWYVAATLMRLFLTAQFRWDQEESNVAFDKVIEAVLIERSAADKMLRKSFDPRLGKFTDGNGKMTITFFGYDANAVPGWVDFFNTNSRIINSALQTLNTDANQVDFEGLQRKYDDELTLKAAIIEKVVQIRETREAVRKAKEENGVEPEELTQRIQGLIAEERDLSKTLRLYSRLDHQVDGIRTSVYSKYGIEGAGDFVVTFIRNYGGDLVRATQRLNQSSEAGQVEKNPVRTTAMLLALAISYQNIFSDSPDDLVFSVLNKEMSAEEGARLLVERYGSSAEFYLHLLQAAQAKIEAVRVVLARMPKLTTNGKGNGVKTNGNGVLPNGTPPVTAVAQPTEVPAGRSVDLAFPENPVVQDAEYQKSLRALIRSFWSITSDKAREDLIFQALTAPTDGKEWANLEAKLLPNPNNPTELKVEKLKVDRQERIALFAVLFALARQPLVGKTVKGQVFQEPIVSRPSVTFVSKVRGQLLASNNPARFANINDITLSPTFAAQFSGIPFDAILQKVTEAFGEFKDKKQVGNGQTAATATAAAPSAVVQKTAVKNGGTYVYNPELSFEDNLKNRAKDMIVGLSDTEFNAVWAVVERKDLTPETLGTALKDLGIKFTPLNKAVFSTLRALYQTEKARPKKEEIGYKAFRYSALLNSNGPESDQRLDMVIPGLREATRSVLSVVNAAGVDAAMNGADLKGDLINVARLIGDHLATLKGFPDYLKQAYQVGDVESIRLRAAKIVRAIDPAIDPEEQFRLLGEWQGIELYLQSLVAEALGQVVVVSGKLGLSLVEPEKPEPLKFARRVEIPSGLIMVPDEVTFAGSTTEPPNDAAMSARKTILLVDDEVQLLETTEMMLQLGNPGAQFKRARNGLEAVEMLKRMTPAEQAELAAVYADTDTPVIFQDQFEAFKLNETIALTWDQVVAVLIEKEWGEKVGSDGIKLKANLMKEEEPMKEAFGVDALKIISLLRNAVETNGFSVAKYVANNLPADVKYVAKSAFMDEVRIKQYQGIFAEQPGRSMVTIGIPEDISKLVQMKLVEDPAMVPGGIDLNAGNMTLNEKGEPVDFQFDPAVAERFRQGNFTGITPVILNITPIPSLSPLLGMEAGAEQPEKV